MTIAFCKFTLQYCECEVLMTSYKNSGRERDYIIHMGYH